MPCFTLFCTPPVHPLLLIPPSGVPITVWRTPEQSPDSGNSTTIVIAAKSPPPAPPKPRGNKVSPLERPLQSITSNRAEKPKPSAGVTPNEQSHVQSQINLKEKLPAPSHPPKVNLKSHPSPPPVPPKKSSLISSPANDMRNHQTSFPAPPVLPKSVLPLASSHPIVTKSLPSPAAPPPVALKNLSPYATASPVGSKNLPSDVFAPPVALKSFPSPAPASPVSQKNLPSTFSAPPSVTKSLRSPTFATPIAPKSFPSPDFTSQVVPKKCPASAPLMTPKNLPSPDSVSKVVTENLPSPATTPLIAPKNLPSPAAAPPVAPKNLPLLAAAPPVAPKNLPLSAAAPPVAPKNLPLHAAAPPVAPKNFPSPAAAPPVAPENRSLPAANPPVAPKNFSSPAAALPVAPKNISLPAAPPVAPKNLPSPAAAPPVAPKNLSLHAAAPPVAPKNLSLHAAAPPVAPKNFPSPAAAPPVASKNLPSPANFTQVVSKNLTSASANLIVPKNLPSPAFAPPVVPKNLPSPAAAPPVVPKNLPSPASVPPIASKNPPTLAYVPPIASKSLPSPDSAPQFVPKNLPSPASAPPITSKNLPSPASVPPIASKSLPSPDFAPQFVPKNLSSPASAPPITSKNLPSPASVPPIAFKSLPSPDSSLWVSPKPLPKNFPPAALPSNFLPSMCLLSELSTVGAKKPSLKSETKKLPPPVPPRPIGLVLIPPNIFHIAEFKGKGKEEVLCAGMVAACEKSLNSLSNNNDKSSIQLQDSLCSLCVRCVPAEKFPLAGSEFPLTFDLPSRRAKTAYRRPTTSYTRATDEGKSSDEEPFEMDDDALLEELGEESGASGKEEEESEVNRERRDARSEAARYIKQQTEKPKLANYARFFAERHGVEKVAKRNKPPVPYAQAILTHSQKTKSVMRWDKIAYPDLSNPDRELPLQPLVFSTNSMRQVAARATRRAALQPSVASSMYSSTASSNSSTSSRFTNPRLSSTSSFSSTASSPPPVNSTLPRLVYSLDSLIARTSPSASSNGALANDDRSRLGKIDTRFDHLLFESRFESGNLRAVIQVDRNHYELILQPDINQTSDHYQWFYFEISNGEANVDYTFEIINCLKPSSMFVHGMQPVAFSVGEAVAGRPGWVRFGHSLCYYRNQYVIEEELNGNRKDRFFSLRFTFALRHKGDICYIAYHFPYTFSFLKATLECWLTRSLSSLVARSDQIGHSLAGNSITLITVTAPGSRMDIANRDTVIFTARVHPGESNSSWIMHGILEYLLSCDDPEAREARQKCVFKLIPMLNPDGVISGSHRCSLTGHDLNRVWDSPSRSLHPEIYHSKAIIQNLVGYQRNGFVQKSNKVASSVSAEPPRSSPLLFVDIHGHSRRTGCFVYGNNAEQSWLSSDALLPSLDFLDLPEILDVKSAAFELKNCRWAIERNKEGSARVALWRQLGLQRAYTMECTYSGFQQGPYKGYQIGICELKEIGRNLVQSALELSKLVTPSSSSSSSSGKSKNLTERAERLSITSKSPSI